MNTTIDTPMPTLEAIPAFDDAVPLPPLTTDLANVLALLQRVYVGQPSVRAEIDRVLTRYAEREYERMDELTRARASVVAQMARWEDQALFDGPGGPNF